MTDGHPGLPGLAPADPMIDALDRVRGRTRYVVDVDVPGLAHAALVRSPVAAGRITSIDDRAARSSPGVIAVVTAADVAAVGLGTVRFGAMTPDQPILADGRVAYAGDVVAAVVAETIAQARAAADLIRIGIETAPAVLDADAALATGAPLVHPDRPDNVLARWQRRHGDLDAARAVAVRTYRHEFGNPAAQQASLEPHVCVARWEGDRLEAWATSQNPSRVAEQLAELFGLPPDAVRLHVPPLGGGYGGKNHAKLEPLTALLARLAGRPVRVANTRADEFVTVTKHAARITLESGVDAEGRFVFRTARLRWSGGAYALSSQAVIRAGGMSVIGPYRMRAAAVDSVVAYTNLPPAGSFRGLGVTQAAWAGEQQVDVIAADLGLDPVEVRRRNLVRPGDRLWTGELAGDARWLECLDQVVADLEATRPVAAGTRPDVAGDERSTRRGRGVAVVMKQTSTPSRSEAEVALRPDGTVEVRTSAVDMGQGVPTVLARIAGRVLGVGLDRIRPVLPDTARTPFDASSSASRLTYAVGEAVERAAADLLDRLLESASVALRVPPDRLRREAGRTVANDGAAIADGEVVAATGREIVGRAVFVNEPAVDPATGIAVTSSHWHQGALAIEIAVDERTGVVRLERAHGAAWAGEVVSVTGARLQNEGNIVFGLGSALFESLDVDAAGATVPRTLLDYRLPSIVDLPPVVTTRALEADPAGRRERHGLGESVIPAVAPAIGNALAAATGARVTELPLRPERVLAALAARDRRAEPTS